MVFFMLIIRIIAGVEVEDDKVFPQRFEETLCSFFCPYEIFNKKLTVSERKEQDK